MFDDFLSKIRELGKRAEEIDGEHSVPLAELFSDEFVLRHTDFPTFAELLAASGFRVESQDDFRAIPETEWNEFVRLRSRFTSWEEMLSAASHEWISRKMGLD